jgi:DNA-binding Lrp family transcriptional regulator
MSIDLTDIRILEELKEDGRRSLREIAKNQDMSPSTSSNRFRKMREEGIIKGFQPIIDYEKLGFDFTTVTHIGSESGKIEDIQESLKQKSYVSSFFLVTGETDIIVISRFRSRKEMNENLRDLQSLDGVEDTNTNVVLESEGDMNGVKLEALKESLDS